ncbi:MAG TPA: glycerate-2-kinase family protein, partial [Pyrinomonadaceae bacterium]|nr:glycerate-2-kinase family protein [Pyrinomonadaceae bacterium]
MPDDALTRLRRAAREIFGEALAASDAGAAVRRSVRLEGGRLLFAETEFDLRLRPPRIYSVALGKAAWAMASALDEVLGERLSGGVVSCVPPLFVNSTANLTPADSEDRTRLADALDARAGDARDERRDTLPEGVSLSKRWRVFAGGHPVPNEASLAAARAAFGLLRRAEEDARGPCGALVVFLVSGGGSAMLEWPRDESLTLEDLREANRRLVACGASINEVNVVRRALSSVKGGGLARRAPHAAQVTLVVSDTNAGDEASVASGPTFPTPPGADALRTILSRYKLETLLPARVLDALKRLGDDDAKSSTHDDRSTENVSSDGPSTDHTSRGETPSVGAPRSFYV